MRSLSIDDIEGARPARRQFQKKMYREKHNEQVEKFSRPELQLLGDVYLQSRSQRFHDGMPNFISNLSNSKGSRFGYSGFISGQSKSPENPQNSRQQKWAQVDLSQSMPINLIEPISPYHSKSLSTKPEPSQSPVKSIRCDKVQSQSPRKSLARSGVLSESGLKSLTSKTKMLQNHPYFPQIYGDEKEIFCPTRKFTGNRYWNDQATQSISLQKDDRSYFPKWGP